jgi:hypothetical protein
MDEKARFQETTCNGGQTGTGGLPGPLRRFADRLDEIRSAETFDMGQVGRALVELTAGVETHQKWDAVRQAGVRAELRLADEALTISRSD